MELFEALVVSFISTVTFLAVALTLHVKTRRIKVLGPYSFKLNDSGDIKVGPAPPEIAEALNKIRDKLVQEVQREYGLPNKTMKWYYIVIITIAIFMIQFIVFCLCIKKP